MFEGALYLASSFWLGALHAATPGHGKTVSAAYLVGARGRPADALALGIFVTLSHTCGIVLFALLATLGSTLLSQKSERHVALATAVLIVGIGLWALRDNWCALTEARAAVAHTHPLEHGYRADPPGEDSSEHSHGWGKRHSHRLDTATSRPSWALLLGLGVAGGILPDPAALAVLLAAIGSGKLVLGLFTILVFSLGFASVLIVVGMIAARVGQFVLGSLHGRWLDVLRLGTSVLITGVGVTLAVGAWRALAA
jgi:nickel/cobalt transporter (NicO) family protein